MNREIKFRGLCIKDQIDGICVGIWVFGDLEYNKLKDKARIHAYRDNGDYYRFYDIDPDTIGQYTGLKDKNGVEIYEGDIIKIVDNCDDEPYNAEVKFYKGVFGVENWTENTRNRCLTTLNHFMPTIGLYDEEQEYTVEVIGNIYDNPELLSAK